MAWRYYDYVCEDCEEAFEAMVQYEDRDREPCPFCDSTEVTRKDCSPRSNFMANDPVRRKEALMKRSEKHTAKEQRAGNLPTVHDYADYRGKKD